MPRIRNHVTDYTFNCKCSYSIKCATEKKMDLMIKLHKKKCSDCDYSNKKDIAFASATDHFIAYA